MPFATPAPSSPPSRSDFAITPVTDQRAEIVITCQGTGRTSPVNHPEVRDNLEVISAFLLNNTRERGILLREAEA